MEIVFTLILTNTASVFIGFILDYFAGSPKWDIHPVRLAGLIISRLEKIFYKDSFLAGSLFTACALLSFFGFFAVLCYTAWKISPVLYVIVSSLGVWSSISIKDTGKLISKISSALKANDIPLARQMLALAVSHDTAKISEERIIASAIHSTGESISCTAASPLFYSFLAGGAGGLFFRCVNALALMASHKSPCFGKVPMLINDILGFIPSKLMIIPLIISVSLAKLDAKAAWHCLINYGNGTKYGAAAFAGALKITLGGPLSYGGEVYDEAFIPGGSSPLSAYKIDTAVELYLKSAQTAVILGMFVLTGIGYIFT